MSISTIVFSVIGWLFGFVVAAIGVVNMFWGNDPEYGVFILLLSFTFFPPVNTLLKAKTGYRIHPILKVLLGIFVIWSALGVAELPAKIDLMMKSFTTRS